MGTTRFACDPNLTGNLTAEYDALQNDLEQAKLLAADYQSQLSDKSNDNAALKLTLEKTAADLVRLQSHIVALRTERHNLANEVMRIVLLEAKLAAATEENKRLKEEIKNLKGGAPRRDFIRVEDEDPQNLIVIPTACEPRAPGPFRPRSG